MGVIFVAKNSWLPRILKKYRTEFKKGLIGPFFVGAKDHWLIGSESGRV